MPNLFQSTRFVLMALILLSVSTLFTACGKTKGTPQESLYGEINAQQGKQYDVLVSEYIGTAPLYCNCTSNITEQGRGENASVTSVTDCPKEIRSYLYEALIPVLKDGQPYFLPLQIRSYEKLNLSDYEAARLTDGPEAQLYYKVPAVAHLDVSQFQSYRGPGDYVFVVPHVESDTEARSHLSDETISKPDGQDDRP